MKISAQLLAVCLPLGATAFMAPQAVKPTFAIRSLPAGASASTWDLVPADRIEGQTRKTWEFGDVSKETVQVLVKSGGRPMNTDIQVWIGPDWTPSKIETYSESGDIFPVQALIGTRGKSATVEVRNTSPYEYPIEAACKYAPLPLADIRNAIPKNDPGRYVEGGAVYTVSFDLNAKRVGVLLNTDTRQLNARVELLNGPNNIKQGFEVFTNNGMLNSIYMVFQTAGGGSNTVRVKNLAPLEFPLRAFVAEA